MSSDAPGTPDVCPVCEYDYNHVIRNGFRNRWPGDEHEVCTTDDRDWMYVHTTPREEIELNE